MARMSVARWRGRTAASAARHSGGGGRVELSYFLEEKTPEHFAAEAARQAIVSWTRWMRRPAR